MGKRKTEDVLQDLDVDQEDAQEGLPTPAAATAAVSQGEPVGQVENASVVVPLCMDAEVPMFCVHLDVRLEPRQAAALRRLSVALDRQQATFADGRRVQPDNYGAAVKWLLEQVPA